MHWLRKNQADPTAYNGKQQKLIMYNITFI